MKLDIQRYGEILVCTSCIPQELHQLVSTAQETRGASCTVEQAVEAYTQVRMAQWSIQMPTSKTNSQVPQAGNNRR